jgi:hypothetical protein
MWQLGIFMYNCNIFGRQVERKVTSRLSTQLYPEQRRTNHTHLFKNNKRKNEPLYTPHHDKNSTKTPTLLQYPALAFTRSSTSPSPPTNNSLNAAESLPVPFIQNPTKPTPNRPNSASRNFMIGVAGRTCSLFRTQVIHCWDGTRGRGVVPPRTEARMWVMCGQGCRIGFSR